jgi:peptidoglycan/LPS O-acetylase OafA/YrhL
VQADPVTAIEAGRVGEADSTAAITHSRSIPSLDGLRAVAILLVISAHCWEKAIRSPAMGAYLFELGGEGVYLFFIISGFLITFLLIREKSASGNVDLKSFYFRRTLRIFPPFYAYLAVVLIFWIFGFPEKWQSLLVAATYTSNYYLPPIGGLLACTWSLSLEEQFYLFWPFCVKNLTLARVRILAACLILLMPFSRALTAHFFPAVHAAGKASGMLQTRLDTLMFGCLLALVLREKKWTESLMKALRPWSFLLALAMAFVILPILHGYGGVVYRFFYLSLEGIALAWALAYVVLKPETIAGRLLNLRPVKYVGVLSYGIYLYQQIFVVLRMGFLLVLAGSFAAAFCSHYLVERPSFRLRDRLADRRRSVTN